MWLSPHPRPPTLSSPGAGLCLFHGWILSPWPVLQPILGLKRPLTNEHRHPQSTGEVGVLYGWLCTSPAVCSLSWGHRRKPKREGPDDATLCLAPGLAVSVVLDLPPTLTAQEQLLFSPAFYNPQWHVPLGKLKVGQLLSQQKQRRTVNAPPYENPGCQPASLEPLRALPGLQDHIPLVHQESPSATLLSSTLSFGQIRTV